MVVEVSGEIFSTGARIWFRESFLREIMSGQRRRECDRVHVGDLDN